MLPLLCLLRVLTRTFLSCGGRRKKNAGEPVPSTSPYHLSSCNISCLLGHGILDTPGTPFLDIMLCNTLLYAPRFPHAYLYMRCLRYTTASHQVTDVQLHCMGVG